MIGKMDQRITLQRKTAMADGAGGVTETWANLATNAQPWAAVKAKSGREGMTEGRMVATFVTTFTIHNRDDLTELDRIVWGGENYNIRGIRREGGRQLFLIIEAERGVAQ